MYVSKKYYYINIKVIFPSDEWSEVEVSSSIELKLIDSLIKIL